MGMFDWFAIELTCLDCGTVHKASSLTDMQTKIRTDMSLEELKVGMELDIDTPVCSCGYIEITPSKKGGSFSLIESWTCSKCPGVKWAVVTIENYTLINGNSVEITKATIEAVNYISEEIGYYGWNIENGIAVFEENF